LALRADSSTIDAWVLEADDLVDVDLKAKREKAKQKSKKVKVARNLRGDGESPTKRRRVVRDDNETLMDVEESSDEGPAEDVYDPGRDSEASSDEMMDAELSEQDDVSPEDDLDDDDLEPRTPSKRRGRPRVDGTPRTPRTPRHRGGGAASTPSRRGRKLAAPTPHSKAALRARKRSIAVRPPPPQLSREHYRALNK
jgi:origin recognition complex subunit 1